MNSETTGGRLTDERMGGGGGLDRVGNSLRVAVDATAASGEAGGGDHPPSGGVVIGWSSNIRANK